MRHGRGAPAPCQLPSPHRLLPLRHLPQEQSRLFGIFMWLDACGNPSKYVPGEPASGFWRAGNRRDPLHPLCRDVGRVSARPGGPLVGTRPPRPQNAWRLLCRGQRMCRQGWCGFPEQTPVSSCPWLLWPLQSSPCPRQQHRAALEVGTVPAPVPCPCRCLHPPVRGGAGPGEVLGAERRGPRCHGLLDGGFLAVGLEERR